MAVAKKLMKNGFVVLEDFLWETECDELIEAGLEFSENLPDDQHKTIFSTAEHQKQHIKEKYFLESNDKMRCFYEADAVAPDGTLQVDPKKSLNKVGHALHLLHPIFRCYTYCPRVAAVCRRLGFKRPAVVQSMYIFKNPGIGGEVAPHQDATYLYTEPVPPIGFWIALEDATVENGCLWIAPGSHTSGVHRRLIRNPAKNAEEALIYDKPPCVYPISNFRPVPVTKGTCILLHGHVVHKSAHNQSSKSRPAYTFHVVETLGNIYSADNWLQEGPKAPFLDLYTTNQDEYWNELDNTLVPTDATQEEEADPADSDQGAAATTHF